MTAPYRPEFEAALKIFARVSEAMAASGHPRPILVGGAAVEYYSGSAISTGDFDLCSPAQDALDAILPAHGFIRPAGAGQLLRGWIHPELKLGFEIVGTAPFDGHVTRDHIALVEDVDNCGSFAIISLEDVIADRMGQYASGAAPEMLDQARLLMHLHPDIDRTYLEKRIRFETAGEYGIEKAEGN